MKSEVHKRRVSTKVKTSTQDEDREHQRALHSKAVESIGILASGNLRGSETVKDAVRKSLQHRRDR